MGTARAVRRFTIDVNPVYCKGCEICVQVCPKDLFVINDRQKAVVTTTEGCTGCLNCEIYCPDFAIDVQEVELNG
ncbi:MAG: 4Fe-4S dicluster domain-containing protein [Bacillota bacterium]